MVWSNGIKYSGMWKDGLYHGQGEMKHENGGGYRGLWREGLRHGEGQSLYGGKWGYDKWEGHFKEDLADGSGTMHMANGTSETFVFEGGELAGECKSEASMLRVAQNALPVAENALPVAENALR